MTKVSPAIDFDSHLYAITHDLKSFSRAMRIIPDWITEDMGQSGVKLPEPVIEHISMLQQYARGMDRMLDGLTDLSRVGRQSDMPSKINLLDAMEKAWEDVAGKERFRAHFSNLDIMIFGPENDIQRLFRSLLTNCVDHHDKDTGTVRVIAKYAENRVTLEVTDDGPGIAPEYREKVFEPLQTLFPKDESGHSGLGLTIARKIVDTMGGDISVADSRLGVLRGCTIRCVLPAV